jgi:hypothetical protein
MRNFCKSLSPPRGRFVRALAQDNKSTKSTPTPRSRATPRPAVLMRTPRPARRVDRDHKADKKKGKAKRSAVGGAA